MKRRAFVALGSNLGDRWENLRMGLRHLPDIVAVSRVYETDPVGGPPQGPYLNMVAELRTDVSPGDLLTAARKAESAAGRERDERWGPRTLDVDVLLVGDEVIATPELTLPHPRMWERPFVMVPLGDLAPELLPEPVSEAGAVGVRYAGLISATVAP